MSLILWIRQIHVIQQKVATSLQGNESESAKGPVWRITPDHDHDHAPGLDFLGGISDPSLPSCVGTCPILADIGRHFPGLHTPLAGLSKHAADVLQGYEDTTGFSTSYFLELFGDDTQKPLLGAQEFGTVHNVLVVHALITENAARQYSSAPDALSWAMVTTKRAFYPQSRQWRQEILTRGLRVLRQALFRSTSLSSLFSTTHAQV